MTNINRPELIPQPAYPDWPPVERELGGKTANFGNQFDWMKHRCQRWGSLVCEVPNLLWESTAILVGRMSSCHDFSTSKIRDNSTFEDIAQLCSNVSTVGTNGGPSAYGTYDQNGNVREWVDAGSTTTTTHTQEESIVAGGFSVPNFNISPMVLLDIRNLNLTIQEQWIGQINIRQTNIGSVSGSAPISQTYDLLHKDGSPINYFDLLTNQGLFPIRTKIIGDNSTNRKNLIYFFCAENHRFPGSLVVWEFDSIWKFIRSLPLVKRTENDSPISSYARTILDMFDFEWGQSGPGDGIKTFFNPPDTFNRFGSANARNIEIVKRFKRIEYKPTDLTNLGVDDVGLVEVPVAAVAGGGYDTDAWSSDIDLRVFKVINPLPTKAYGTDAAGPFVNDILPGDETLARPKHDVLPVPLGYGFRIATTDNPYNYPNFVTVEDLHNEPHEITGLGTVDYEYQIGKFLVTNDEYAEFLNIVGGADFFGLYDARMAWGEVGFDGPKTFRVNGIIYSKRYNKFIPNEGYSGKPAYWVSYYSAMRYCNWLHHGKPKNRASNYINSGAYNIVGSALENINVTSAQAYWRSPFSREVFTARKTPKAKYYIPTIDEWYKAAFYKGNV